MASSNSGTGVEVRDWLISPISPLLSISFKILDVSLRNCTFNYRFCSFKAQGMNGSGAKCDLVMIQMLLLFKCKLLCYHAN